MDKVQGNEDDDNDCKKDHKPTAQEKMQAEDAMSQMTLMRMPNKEEVKEAFLQPRM